jgi:hypothetical protein
VKTGEIYRTVTVQYSDNCVSQTEVYEYVEGGRVLLRMGVLDNGV